MRTTITILTTMLVAFATGCAHSGKQAYTPAEYYQQGLANESAGNMPRAMMHYGQAVDADPMHAPSLYHMAVLQTNACDYARAIPTWRQYIKATSNSAEAWSNLGWTYEKMCWPLQAESAYRNGVAANAKSKACQTNLGLFLARHGQASEALAHLQTCMTPAEARQNVAAIYREQGLNAKAEQELAKINQPDADTIVSTQDTDDNEEMSFETEDAEESDIQPVKGIETPAQDETAFFSDDADTDMQQSNADADEQDDADAQTENETDLLINLDPH